MKAERRNLQLSRMILLSAGCAIIATGCAYPDKEPSYLRKTTTPGSSFEMVMVGWLGPFQPKEMIRAIQVFEADSLYTDQRQVHWEIVAEAPVSAKGFLITVGEIPEGFHQMIPEPPDVFEPVPGRRYYIAVSFTHPQAMPWVPTEWVAEH